ncbi:MAG: polysaccharide deacetylase family protein, partial [Pseudomonadota bacterium]
TGLAGLGFVLGRYTFWLPGAPKQAPRLIMYHEVNPDQPESGLNIHPAHFDRQIGDLVKKGYRFLTVSELAAEIKAGKTRFAKTALITFDDGFDNNYTHAFPVLKKHGAKATIYLSPEYQGIPFLQDDQIQEMADSGLIEFGAHTLHHVNLTKTDAKTADQEISQSKEKVQVLSGKPCLSFAYPYGRYGDDHIEMVKQAGFTSAVTTHKKPFCPDAGSLYTLPRLTGDGRMNRLQWHIALSKGRYRL